MVRFFILGVFLIGLCLPGRVESGKIDSPDPSSEQSIPALEKRVRENPENIEYRYALGIAYNEVAMHDDEDALERAIAIMNGILDDDPTNRRARAMLGSMTVMKAQHASLFSKLDYVREGYGILDEVVARYPHDPDLRLIRGANAARSPGFLGRGEIADQDFAWLLQDIEAHPEKYDDQYTRTICYYAGDWLLERREKRAVELLFRAKALPGAPRLAEPIAEALQEAKKMFPSTYRALEAQ